MANNLNISILFLDLFYQCLKLVPLHLGEVVAPAPTDHADADGARIEALDVAANSLDVPAVLAQAVAPYDEMVAYIFPAVVNDMPLPDFFRADVHGGGSVGTVDDEEFCDGAVVGQSETSFLYATEP